VRVDEIVATYDVSPVWKPFPLHPRVPEEGIPLERYFGVHRSYFEPASRRLRELCDAAGLELGDAAMIYDTRLAQELAVWAERQEGGEGLHMALFRAYFVDTVNVGRVDELVRIAAGVGLDPGAARRTLETRACSDAVDAHWEDARQHGVTGVPTFVASGLMVVGAQPIEVMRMLVEKAGAQRRPGGRL
jgi:predicted DsbA family dithiol-disulfide isomerase